MRNLWETIKGCLIIAGIGLVLSLIINNVIIALLTFIGILAYIIFKIVESVKEKKEDKEIKKSIEQTEERHKLSVETSNFIERSYSKNSNLGELLPIIDPYLKKIQGKKYFFFENFLDSASQYVDINLACKDRNVETVESKVDEAIGYYDNLDLP